MLSPFRQALIQDDACFVLRHVRLGTYPKPTIEKALFHGAWKTLNVLIPLYHEVISYTLWRRLAHDSQGLLDAELGLLFNHTKLTPHPMWIASSLHWSLKYNTVYNPAFYKHHWQKDPRHHTVRNTMAALVEIHHFSIVDEWLQLPVVEAYVKSSRWFIGLWTTALKKGDTELLAWLATHENESQILEALYRYAILSNVNIRPELQQDTPFIIEERIGRWGLSLFGSFELLLAFVLLLRDHASKSILKYILRYKYQDYIPEVIDCISDMTVHDLVDSSMQVVNVKTTIFEYGPIIIALRNIYTSDNDRIMAFKHMMMGSDTLSLDTHGLLT